jgi:hypothetical protein
LILMITEDIGPPSVPPLPPPKMGSQMHKPWVLVWPVLLAQVWTPKYGNSTCEHCFAMYAWIFWTAKYERESCLNWKVNFQVLSRPQLIFSFKTWFFGIYLIF